MRNLIYLLTVLLVCLVLACSMVNDSFEKNLSKQFEKVRTR